MVLEAAVNGRADVLVTFNRRDYGAMPLQFGIEVLRGRAMPSGELPHEHHGHLSAAPAPVDQGCSPERFARAEGVSLNQLVATAVAEKLAALNRAVFFAERRDRADLAAFRRIVTRPGGQPPKPATNGRPANPTTWEASQTTREYLSKSRSYPRAAPV